MSAVNSYGWQQDSADNEEIIYIYIYIYIYRPSFQHVKPWQPVASSNYWLCSCTSRKRSDELLCILGYACFACRAQLKQTEKYNCFQIVYKFSKVTANMILMTLAKVMIYQLSKESSTSYTQLAKGPSERHVMLISRHLTGELADLTLLKHQEKKTYLDLPSQASYSNVHSQQTFSASSTCDMLTCPHNKSEWWPHLVTNHLIFMTVVTITTLHVATPWRNGKWQAQKSIN